LINLARFAAVGCLIAIICLASIREHTLLGASATFLLLVALALPALVATRFLAATSIVLSVLLYLINFADLVKYEATRLHLSYGDLGIISQFAIEADFSIFEQYGNVAKSVSLFLLIGVVTIAAVAWLEKRSPKPPTALGPLWALALVPLSLAAMILFMQSAYMGAVKSQIVQRMSSDRAPLRVSTFLAEISEGYALAAQLATDKATFPGTSSKRAAEPCGDCPDIIVVHLESVYDPRFESAYADAPSFATLFGSRMERWSSLLRVHNWGGPSVITEFEFLCSLRHELFGWAGVHPHTKVGPYISGCLGGDLKTLGYESTALYTFSGSFSDVRKAFSNYGIANFHDPADLSLPSDWSKLRDHLIFDRLRDRLAAPRTTPRFFWVSTNWNHGPHGTGRVTDRFDGPYDASKADSKPLEDYINRLNDTIAAVRSLEAHLANSPTPTLLILFGDHHPAFAKNFSPAAREEYRNIDYLTPFVALRNFKGPDIPVETIVNVQDAAYYLSRLAGVPSLPNVGRIFELKAKCGGDELACPAPLKSEMRAIQLR
jgi:Phosphoglycerol transferase and related proteins, alkaline phosphatase superfamily